MNWKPGMKALCVDDSAPQPPPGHTFANPPDSAHLSLKKETIYLVSGVVPQFVTGRPMLTLAPDPAISDYGWLAHRFRPIIHRSEREGREQTALEPHAGFWENRPDLP